MRICKLTAEISDKNSENGLISVGYHAPCTIPAPAVRKWDAEYTGFKASLFGIPIPAPRARKAYMERGSRSVHFPWTMMDAWCK